MLMCQYMLALILCSLKDSENRMRTTMRRREEDQGQRVRNVRTGSQRGMQGTPPWRHLSSQCSGDVLGDLRGKRNGYRPEVTRIPATRLPLSAARGGGGSYQEVPWLSGTSEGEDIKKKKEKHTHTKTKKTQQGVLEAAGEGLHKWSVHMVRSLFATQWSGPPVKHPCPCSQEDFLIYAPGGPWDQLGVPH